MDVNDFISKDKAILIAPAGFGKTHFIANCLQYTEGKQLILTHTNAGVAALNEKIKKQGIPSSKYNVETISGYAQKYVYSFYKQKSIPPQEDSSVYYPFLIDNFKKIFALTCISNILKKTYSGIFVDEYQDCTKSQHEMVLLLSNHVSTRLIGDPMQGIFTFSDKDPLVDMLSKKDMGDFLNYRYELHIPWRWNICGCEELGKQLLLIRNELQVGNNILLYDKYKSISIYKFPKDYKKDFSNYIKDINSILKSEDNVLFIHPQSATIEPRLKFVKQFKNRVYLIESLDDKIFYSFAKSLDSLTKASCLSIMFVICKEIFGKTSVDEWMTQTKIKRRLGYNKEKSILLQSISSKLDVDPLLARCIIDFLKVFKLELKLTVHRKDLYDSLVKSIEYSKINSTTIYEGMCAIRNRIRRCGRKIQGKCIGTTLLTKGLECECVVLLNANEFPDNKHLYVALTRGAKKVIVFI